MSRTKLFSRTTLLAALIFRSVAYTPTAPAAPGTKTASPVISGFDYERDARLPWKAEGYGKWSWNGHNINYLEMGDPSRPALLLIHGFGASSYHFRHNVPDLARDYHVFAFDLLGFGLSSKPVQQYPAEVWKDQAVDFIEHVIGKSTTIAGNSLGGFTALYAASTLKGKSLIDGCILLNAAGRFRDADNSREKENIVMDKIKKVIQRIVIYAAFLYTKQPSRIEQILKSVYPVNSENVDQELVESIQLPSQDENAAEVFYRVITKNDGGPSVYVDDLLGEIDCSLLLCWGQQDPWIRPLAADKIEELYPRSKRVSIEAGHCPHDEAPFAVNCAIREFMKDKLREEKRFDSTISS